MGNKAIKKEVQVKKEDVQVKKDDQVQSYLLLRCIEVYYASKSSLYCCI